MTFKKKDRAHLCALIVTLAVCGSYFLAQKVSAPGAPVTPAPIAHADFREISRIDTGEKVAVITVDAGFGERSAEGLLTALSKHRIKATFFLVGQWIEDHPELTRRIVGEGHEIFNHSYSHPDYTLLAADDIKADLQKMDDTLYRIAGLRTRPYYRAPSGARNAAVNEAAKDAGYQHIYWSIDPQDWRLDVSGETIKNRVVSNLHPGAIVLLHIADSTTGEIADELFTEMEKRGYKLVSLTEVL